jgi:branched-chain amino acid transport system substrate-binding protein
MTDISLVVRRSSSASPEVLWRALGRGSTSGWPLLHECHTVEVGAALLFGLPDGKGGTVTASGRISEIQAGVSLTVRQETPWPGRVKITLSPTGSGSNVTVTVTLDESCVDWFLSAEQAVAARPGLNLVARAATPRKIKLGLLAPLSGPAGILGPSVVNATRLAVEELNASQGFYGREAELIVEDDRSLPLRASQAFDRLANVHRCDAVIANISSASMERVRPLVWSRGTLMLSTGPSERHDGGRTFFQLGESPADQLCTWIPRIMREEVTHNWFVLGNDYIWPRTVGAVAKDLINRHRGRVAGETYTPLGSTEFDEVIDAIAASGADVILSSLVGVDAVKFERRFYDSGLRGDFRTLAVLFDEAVLEHVGPEQAQGIWSAQDYFMPTLADELDDVAFRYQTRFGTLAPPLTGMGKAAHDAVHTYALAAQAARSFEPLAISAVLRAGKFGSAKLRRRVRGDLTPASAAKVTSGGFSRVHSA